MKKRVLSALLVLCMACSMVSTVWAANEQATPETADEPASVLLDDSQSAPVTNAPAQDQDVAEGLTAPEDEESGQQSDVDTPDASQPEQAESTGTPVEGGVEYTAALEQDGQALNVIVTAPEGAFDAGVEPKLSVSAIEDETALDTIASELDGNVEYDGFAALDIRFVDVNGNEIEPNAPVKVRIELPDSIVDSGIDLSTLAVQHLAEDEAGNVTAVEQVASVADGTVTLSDAAIAAINKAAGIATMSEAPANDALIDEAAIVAEFEVEGFSQFTITWQSGKNETPVEVNCYYYDEDGELQSIPNKDGVPDLDTTLGDGGSISFVNNPDLAIDGYTFKEAKYVFDNGPETPLTSIEIGRESGFMGIGYWYVIFNNDGNEQYKNKRSVTINLYYDVENDEPLEPVDPSEPTNATVTTGKSVVLDDETGNYTLNLSVSGDQTQSGGETLQADIVFIIDRSSSMWAYYGGTGSLAYQTRMAVLQGAVSDFLDDIESKGIDARYSAIQFGHNAEKRYGSGQVNFNKILQPWTSSAEDLENAIDSLAIDHSVEYEYTGGGMRYAGVGTNVQAGIRLANNNLLNQTPAIEDNNSANAPRDDAKKIVILISDGAASYSYNDKGNETSSGSESTHKSRAVKEIGNTYCDYFYAIGVSKNYDWNFLNDLKNAVHANDKAQVIGADNDDQLNKAFEDLITDITFFAANNITMTDPLSDYADLVATGDDGTYEFTIQLEYRQDENSNYQVVDTKTVSAGERATLTYSLGGKTENVAMTPTVSGKTITVDFADDYELAQNYRYTVSTTIKPSDKAIEETSLAYSGTGETNTGTHAGELGFWSNDNANAKVTFDAITYPEGSDTPTVTASNQEEFFPKPVIQVTASPVTPPEADPAIRKYVDDNHDGSYDLSLDVTGMTVKEIKSVNVLYILDMSYSMMWDMPSVNEDENVYPYPIIDSNPESNHSGDRYYFYADKNGEDVYDEKGLGPIPYSWYRYNVAKRAIETLNQALTSDVLDVDTKLITFNQSAKSGDWQDLSEFELSDPAYNLFGTGTSYVDALNAANDALNQMDAGEKNQDTYVIFITDGNPNRAALNTSTSSSAQNGIDAAKNYLDDMPAFVDGLYVIGVSDDVGKGYLDDLVEVTPEGIPYSVYRTSEASELVQRFTNIAAEIGGVDVHNVTIVDELSEYAELTSTTAIPQIKIQKDDGSLVTVEAPTTESEPGADGVVTYQYSFADKTGASSTSESTQTLTYTYYPANTYGESKDNAHPVITLDFPDEYRLTKGWTYTITLPIQPTAAASTYLSEHNGTYPNKGERDEETGIITDVPGSIDSDWTSTDKEGFFSNTEATLTYDSNDTTDLEKTYLKPVIQVNTADLTITKAIVVDDDASDNLSAFNGQTFDFTVKNEAGEVVGTARITWGQNNNTATVSDLPIGNYTVSETDPAGAPTGYTFVGKGSDDSVTVTANGGSASITNHYKHNDVILTVNKYVTGDLSFNKDEFTFSLKLTNSDNTPYTGAAIQNGELTPVKDESTEEDKVDEYTFTLTAETGYNTLQIVLPYGVNATVTETDQQDYQRVDSREYETGTTEVSYIQGKDNQTVTMESDRTIDFLNTKDLVEIPTGLDRNDTPYTLMVTAAGIAGLALIGAIVNRRIRRRREE